MTDILPRAKGLTPEDIVDIVLNHAGECRCRPEEQYECEGCMWVRLIKQYGDERAAEAKHDH